MSTPAPTVLDPPGTDLGALGGVVDGQRTTGSGDPVRVVSAATGAVLLETAAAGRDDVDHAVRVARRAHERVWTKLSGAQRGRHLYRLAGVLADRADELARLEALDAGTPVRHSRATGLPAAHATALHHAGWADKLAHAGFGPGPDGAGPRAPGVAGLVVSSSSSLLATVGLLCPALACGATVVLKPAGTTPLSTLALVDAVHEAGLPPGVLNVVLGGDEVGSTLMAHADVRTVALAGTAALGAAVARAQVGSGRGLVRHPVRASVAVVAADAPLPAAAAGIVDGVRTARARHAATGTVVLAAAAVADELAERLRDRLAALVVGDPTDPATELGPCSSVGQRDAVLDGVAAAELEGAVRWTAPTALPAAGAWLAPTLLTGAPATARVRTAELLGPVVVLVVVPDAAAAVSELRRSPLATAVDLWTTDAVAGTGLAARTRAVAVRLRGTGDDDPGSGADRVEPVVARGPGGLAGWLGA